MKSFFRGTLRSAARLVTLALVGVVGLVAYIEYVEPSLQTPESADTDPPSAPAVEPDSLDASAARVSLQREIPVASCAGESTPLNEAEKVMLDLHNEERTSRGLSPLCLRPELLQSSRAHSADMIEERYFSHDSPVGETSSDRMRSAGYTPEGYASWRVGENIAYRSHYYADAPTRGDLHQVFDGWMQSEGHRENLLNPEFRELGLGTATGEYTPDTSGPVTMYTANFGART